MDLGNNISIKWIGVKYSKLEAQTAHIWGVAVVKNAAKNPYTNTLQDAYFPFYGNVGHALTFAIDKGPHGINTIIRNREQKGFEQVSLGVLETELFPTFSDQFEIGMITHKLNDYGVEDTVT